MKIVTDYWRKPIPTNAYDWTATLDDYDGTEDAGPQPIGYGATEQAAINDLRDRLPLVRDDRDAELFRTREEFRKMTGARVATQIMFGLRAEHALRELQES